MTEKTKLSYILCLKAALLLLLMLSGWIPLAPDEAQYWTWSQALDWGYYSKPPGIAWQIKATTLLLGNNELGVRYGALFISFFLGIALYSLAKALKFSDKMAFWSGILFAFSPLGFYLSFAATTDPGAILFFTLAIIAVVKGPHYIWAGLFIALGALFKWTAFLLWPFVFLALIFLPQMRKKSLIWGILISLVALLPTLYWNASHDFATFKHVAATGAKKGGGNFFDFLGAQIALLSPILFALLVGALAKIYRDKRKDLLFVALIPSGVLLYLFYSFFAKMQPNWAIYLYLPGFALIAWFSVERHMKWLYGGIWLSIFMICAALSTRFLEVPYAMNPFRQNLGWNHLAPALTKAGYDPKTDFLFADKYQMTSLLSFYEQKRAYFFNLNQVRKNQFSYGEQMNPSQIGCTGYFVISENVQESALGWYQSHYEKALAPYFEKVEFRGAYPLFSVSGTPVKHALIFKGIAYNGKSPELIEKY